jgi:hypothetical protein
MRARIVRLRCAAVALPSDRAWTSDSGHCSRLAWRVRTRCRHERDGSSVVDGMRCVRVAQPVDRCGRVDVGVLGCVLHDVLRSQEVRLKKILCFGANHFIDSA